MQEIVAVATAAARAAAAVIRGPRRELGVASKQSRAELVTAVDLEAQRVIASMIADHFPSHSILAEEGDGESAPTDAAALWVVDPLDGTNNFVHGLPQFCVSIAYAEAGETRVGVVLDPNRDELFSAVRGGGAFLNGRPVRVSERGSLDQTMVATGFYYERGEMMERTLDSIRRLFRANIRGIRRFGSAALDLCWLACGRFDAFFEYRLAPWDFAASSLLVEEAGGRVEDRRGRRLELDGGSVVAANPAVFDAFAEIVRWPG